MTKDQTHSESPDNKPKEVPSKEGQAPEQKAEVSKFKEKTTALINKHGDSITKFNNFVTVEEQLAYAEKLIASKMVPFSRPETVVLVINAGKEMGLGPVSSLTNMFSVGGKLGMSNHLMNALARKAGIEVELIKDYEPVYNDDKTQVVDTITTMRFYRYSTLREKVVHQDVSYRWSDAHAAGYTTKDNWITKPRNMMRARCMAEGIRLVAPDVITGVFYSGNEMLDQTGKIIEFDGEGNPIIDLHEQ